MKPNQIFQFGLVCISFATIPASAYQTPTHSEITKNAIGASKLDTRLADIASDIGLSSLDSTLSDGGEYFFGAYIFENSQSISDWIRQGSIDEDSFQGLRFLRHFYNPLAPAGREGLYGGTFLSSLAWGLKPTPGITDPVVQDFSYRNARTYFYQGLVAPSERERKKTSPLCFAASDKSCTSCRIWRSRNTLATIHTRPFPATRKTRTRFVDCFPIVVIPLCP